MTIERDKQLEEQIIIYLHMHHMCGLFVFQVLTPGRVITLLAMTRLGYDLSDDRQKGAVNNLRNSQCA